MWKARAGCAVVLAAWACACSIGDAHDAGGNPPIEPVDLVGETDQGLRLRLDVVDPGEVRLRFPATCRRDEGPGSDVVTVPVDPRPVVVPVDGDGEFALDESYVEDGTDGDEEHVDVRIEGAFGADGTAAGTLEVTARWWNGQSQEFGADCETGSLGWVADGPPIEGDDLFVPLPDPSAPAAAGTDLVARLGSGDLVRVAASTGEVRPVSGSASTDPGAGSAGVPDAGGSSPPTIVGGPGAAPGVAALWTFDLAVVGDGVWAVDAATGALSRFDLAGGGPTATIDVPLDSMAAGRDALWTVSTNAFRSGYALDKRDPVTGTVVSTTPVERGRIVVGPSDVWYADATLAGGRLWRVDPTTATTTSPLNVDIPLHGSPVVASADRVWWLDPSGEGLVAIDVATAQVGPVGLPSAPTSLTADDTGVWTVHPHEAVARRVEGGRVVRTVDLPEGSWEVAVASDGAVWLVGIETEGERWGAVRLDPAVTAG